MTTDKLLEAAQTEALLRGHVMSAMDRFRTKHGIQVSQDLAQMVNLPNVKARDNVKVTALLDAALGEV